MDAYEDLGGCGHGGAARGLIARLCKLSIDPKQFQV